MPRPSPPGHFNMMQKITIRNIEVHPSEGFNHTLQEMAYLESLSLENSDFIKYVYKNFYTKCLPCVPGKIWKYIKENFEYVRDEFDEQLTAPHLMIHTKRGDCDDFALFSKTVIDILTQLEIILNPGVDQKSLWQAHYLLLGKTNEGFTHVVTFAHRGKFLLAYNDPVIIDGANDEFNTINSNYIYRKII